MARYTLEFLRFVALGRPPSTTVTAAEHALLRELASAKATLVEVGVHEGATSIELCKAMDSEGTLHLVDPYVPGVRLEKLLGLCFAQQVAKCALRPWQGRVRFVRKNSLDAASELFPLRAEFVFVDAVHTYEAVRDDFLTWRERLAPTGIIAFHDSRSCAARPDLDGRAGPVRLAEEIRRGEFGAWRSAGEADSVSAFTRG